jgi:predicted enzyme related to lactoylglutathione lyase
MKIRLQEIEFATGNTHKSKMFYQSVLGLDPVIDQDHLKVFNSGVAGVDFNIADQTPGITVIAGFITDDLQQLMDRLLLSGIHFEGPCLTPLGMLSISLQDPDGNRIRINQPTSAAPRWCKI